jgi:hypothetical protein
MSSSADILRQRLPDQELQRLSLVTPQPRKLREWVAALPMINVGETSRQVFQTLQEINRLSIDEATRFELLEVLRPTVHTLVQALSKHYLNQSVMLPERATKVATLAQTMQSHLATGYKLITVHSIDKLQSGKRDLEALKLLAQSLHRAISELTGNLLRSTQLYLNTPQNLWLEMHALYLIAVQYKLVTDARVTDSVSGNPNEKTSIEEAYKRALLLATCKANKLRQAEIDQIYQASAQWAALVTLREFSSSDELFVFDLLKDAPPIYRTLATATEAGHVRAIDPHALVTHLNEVRQTNPVADARTKTIGVPLLSHLIQAWSELSERSFSRISHDGILVACLGLTATHYFLSGGMDFDIMMQGDQARFMIADADNPFLKPQPITVHRPDERTGKDVWALAFGSNDVNTKEQEHLQFQKAESDPTQSRYDTYQCQIVNVSPGGYCIEWSGDVPSSVRSGEILGLHEEGQTGWSIGVIRWIKQLPGHGAQLGIEVLAPKARPCGARVVKKTGDATEYMRTLLLPELKAIGRPATLITPTLTFRSGYKIVLNLNGEELKAQLTTQISTTPSFSQFEFQLLRAPGEHEEETPSTTEAAPAKDDDDFDSIWASL